MAKTWGYALSGFASGLKSGLSLGMENKKIKMLQEEQKRLEKYKEETERIFNEWYLDPKTKEFCNNLDTASQGEKAYFISGLLRISKDLFNYFTEIDNDIREGRIKEAQDKNDLVEAKIKSATDLAKLGMTAVFPDGSPMKIPPEEVEFQKQIQIGKIAGGKAGEAMGRQMWKKRGFGELPPETKEPDLTGAINYLKKFPNPTPEQFESLKRGAGKFYNCVADLADVTFESLWAPEEPAPEPKGRAISLPLQEDYKQKALDANTLGDKKKVVDTYGEAGYDTSAMPTDQEWIDGKLGELDSHVEMLEKITDEEGKLQGSKSFNFMLGDKAVSQTGEQWYKDIYEAYTFYLEELRKMGIDVSKYPRIKSPGEVSKVGFLKGMVTPGVGRGYPSIYYTETAPTPTETPELPKLPSL